MSSRFAMRRSRSLAVFAAQPPQIVDPVRAEILTTMLAASHDREPLLRSTAAFGLGRSMASRPANGWRR